MICDECYALINVLNNKYPEIFYFICGLHKMKNIIKKLHKNSVGEDYLKLLKNLPFN